MIQVIKNTKRYLRHRRLTRHGIVRDLDLPVATFGSRTGMWTTTTLGLSKESVVYSFGVGDNICWDLGMIERLGLEVHAFDPTLRSVKWVKQQSLPKKFRFHEVGLADFDGEQDFYPPGKPGKINFRSVNCRLSHGKSLRGTVLRLETILERLGHSRVDVLKIDIEGAEYSALRDFLRTRIPIRQLLVEFHHNYSVISFEETVDIIQQLRLAGFRIFHISERGYECSFWNTGTLKLCTTLKDGAVENV